MRARLVTPGDPREIEVLVPMIYAHSRIIELGGKLFLRRHEEPTFGILLFDLIPEEQVWHMHPPGVESNGD